MEIRDLLQGKWAPSKGPEEKSESSLERSQDAHGISPADLQPLLSQSNPWKGLVMLSDEVQKQLADLYLICCHFTF